MLYMDETKFSCRIKLHPQTHHICYLDEKTEEMRRDFKIYLLVQENNMNNSYETMNYLIKRRKTFEQGKLHSPYKDRFVLIGRKIIYWYSRFRLY